MAETEWFADEDVSVTEVRVVMEIAATKAGGCYADLDFICFWGRNISRFLDVVSVMQVSVWE